MKIGLCFGGAFANISVKEHGDDGTTARLVPPREPMLARDWLRQLGARRGWPDEITSAAVDYVPDEFMTVDA